MQKKCPREVPTGLRNAFVETAFPTLKRGANKHCAYGAATKTFLMQFTIAMPQSDSKKATALAARECIMRLEHPLRG
jgi:hypothetical protein